MATGTSSTGVAIIVDIVASRELDDRGAAQRAVLAALESASAGVAVVQAPWATVGDEFQVLVASVADALRITALTRLTLPEGLECRFGIGAGDVRQIDEGRSGPIHDGSAWWCARDAIDEVGRIEQRSAPYCRTWFRADASDSSISADLVNAHLLVRDLVIGDMSPRARRLTAGALLGTPQTELARAERISQSAVSQNLRKSGGAAVLAAHRVLVSGALT